MLSSLDFLAKKGVDMKIILGEAIPEATKTKTRIYEAGESLSLVTADVINIVNQFEENTKAQHELSNDLISISKQKMKSVVINLINKAAGITLIATGIKMASLEYKN